MTMYIYGYADKDIDGRYISYYIGGLDKVEAMALQVLYPLFMEGRLTLEESEAVWGCIEKIQDSKPFYYGAYAMPKPSGSVLVLNVIRGFCYRRLTGLERRLVKQLTRKRLN